MVTALDDFESRIQSIEAGADDFISKPFDSLELRARVRAITKLNRYRRLLTERARFEWVVEQAKDGYLIVNDSDEVLYANPQARLYLDLPLSEPRQTPLDTAEGTVFLGTFLELTGKQYRREPGESWATWLAEPDETPALPRYLVRPKVSTSGTLWLQVDVMEMSPQSNLIRLRDVTADVATHSNVWTFHKLIAHKLRTPLGPLIGFLEVLEEDWASFSEAEAKSLLSSSRSGAIRLQNEILDILQYISTINAPYHGQEQCSLAETSETINKIIADLELESARTTLHGIKDLEDTFVHMPCRTMELILRELGENAKKFHPEQSPTLEIEISSVQEGIRIRVCDDGLTLTSEQLAKLWTPYYQIDGYFSGEVPGMGLGLAVVASLVWSAGGKCRAHNREDIPGIVVEIVLPLAKQDDDIDEDEELVIAYA
jgi:signal transduction histidine kinase